MWYFDFTTATPTSGKFPTFTKALNKRKQGKQGKAGKSKEICIKRLRKVTTNSAPFIKRKFQPLIDDDDKIPTYKTKSDGGLRGDVLLINNINFKGDKRGDIAQIDCENLTTLFKDIGFKIADYKDLKAQQMKTTIVEYSRRKFLGDIQIVVIMSYGDSKTYVKSSDGQMINIEWILDQFSKTTCRSLAGKPKIFIIQRYRENREMKESACNAADIYIPSSAKSKKSDVLIAHATVPATGYGNNRGDETGSIFIEAICNVFGEHACDTSIEDLFKMVNARIDNLHPYKTRSCQTPTYENRNFKRCYLNPI